MTLKNEKLIVGVMACCSIKKYKQQMEGCRRTWYKECIKNEVPTYFYTGKIGCNDCIGGDSLIHLDRVRNDFKSSTYKQWYGLKNMYEHHPNADFYFLIGTDTYIQPFLILEMLKGYNRNTGLFFGGDGDFRNVLDKNKTIKVYFHSGGSGFIVSNYTMKLIFEKIDFWIQYWEEITKTGPNSYLNPACDVSIAYLIQKYSLGEIQTTKYFRGCDWKGKVNSYQCCKDDIGSEKILSCHYMTPDQMMEIYHINLQFLKKRN